MVDFTKGKPLPLLFRFAIPICIGYLFQQVYSLADRVIVGRYVGANAFEAIGATSAVSNLFLAVCIGIASGIGVVVSQYYGAKNKEMAAASIANGVYISLAAAVFVTALSLAVTDSLLRLLRTPDVLLTDASLYMKIYMGGTVAVAAFNTPFSIMQGMGDSKTPLYFLIFSSVMNIGLDLLFVVVLQMGVSGAAIATVIAQVLAASLCILYALYKLPVFRLAVKMYRPNKELIKYILKLGLPASVQYSFMYLSNVALQSVVNGFGETAIGAFTATTQVEMLMQQFYLGLANAVMAYTGQNIGAKKPERVNQGFRASVWLCTILSVILLAVFWLFGQSIISIFVEDGQIVSLGTRGIHITGSFLMAYGLSIVLRYLLVGAGDSGYTLMAGAVEIVARIGLGFTLTAIPFVEQMGIWWTTAITWVIVSLFAVLRYRTGKWKLKANIQ